MKKVLKPLEKSFIHSFNNYHLSTVLGPKDSGEDRVDSYPPNQ